MTWNYSVLSYCRPQIIQVVVFQFLDLRTGFVLYNEMCSALSLGYWSYNEKYRGVELNNYEVFRSILISLTMQVLTSKRQVLNRAPTLFLIRELFSFPWPLSFLFFYLSWLISLVHISFGKSKIIILPPQFPPQCNFKNEFRACKDKC